MISKYNIRGTPELYTIAVNSSSLTGDWEFACNVYNDMREKGVIPDEVSLYCHFLLVDHLMYSYSVKSLVTNSLLAYILFLNVAFF